MSIARQWVVRDALQHDHTCLFWPTRHGQYVSRRLSPQSQQHPRRADRLDHATAAELAQCTPALLTGEGATASGTWPALVPCEAAQDGSQPPIEQIVLEDWAALEAWLIQFLPDDLRSVGSGTYGTMLQRKLVASQRAHASVLVSGDIVLVWTTRGDSDKRSELSAAVVADAFLVALHLPTQKAFHGMGFVVDVASSVS